MYHVLLGDVCKTPDAWLSHLKIPKYYKVFINKKKYKAHARASVLFLNIKNENNKSKENKKGKFLAKFPKFIFKGQAPFLFRENSPKFKRGLKGKLNEVFEFLIVHFDIKRNIN